MWIRSVICVFATMGALGFIGSLGLFLIASQPGGMEEKQAFVVSLLLGAVVQGLSTLFFLICEIGWLFLQRKHIKLWKFWVHILLSILLLAPTYLVLTVGKYTDLVPQVILSLILHIVIWVVIYMLHMSTLNTIKNELEFSYKSQFK